jgi:hypothetical protein
MLTLAIIAFGLSILWTAFVVFANMLSDAVTGPFSGDWRFSQQQLLAFNYLLFVKTRPPHAVHRRRVADPI